MKPKPIRYYRTLVQAERYCATLSKRWCWHPSIYGFSVHQHPNQFGWAITVDLCNDTMVANSCFITTKCDYTQRLADKMRQSRKKLAHAEPRLAKCT